MTIVAADEVPVSESPPVITREESLAARPAVVRLCGITTVFGPTVANDHIDLDVASGDVIGLVGGNGAGKSTLMCALCGVLRPDEGSIEFVDRRIGFERYDASAAQANGIRMVHQELSLCGNLSVAENFFIEAPEAARLLPGWRNVYRARARSALDATFPNHGIDVDQEVGRLPIGERQIVEIARAAAAPGVKLLVLDEPTSSLGLERSQQLRAYIRQRASAGLAFIFISHKLHEIIDVATHIMVLRNGRVAWKGEAKGSSVAKLVSAMGGGKAELVQARAGHAPVALGESLVRITGNLVQPLGHDVELRAGEIVGLAGLEGNGQRELLHRIFTASDGTEVARSGRASFISGDRRGEGVFPLWSVLDNIAIGRLVRRFSLGAVSAARERQSVIDATRHLSLDDSRLVSNILELSGGNQQKALVARAMVSDTGTILLDDPTKGVDVGAKAEFYKLIAQISRSGRLVVWHSTEDLEFLECDRVLVFSAGRIVRELPQEAISAETIVDAYFSALTGQRAATPVAAPVRRWSERLVHSAPFIGLLLVLGLMVGINPMIASSFGLDLLLAPALTLVLVALGQMFIVANGDVDLGIGAFAGVVNVISATLLVDRPVFGGAALLGALAGYGVLAAAIQARRIPAIVATLGASFVWTGIGYSLQPSPGGSSPDWLRAAIGWSLGSVPTMPLFIILFTLIALVIDRAPLGVVLRGFGNNPGAMARSGWSPLRYAVLRYLIAGAFGVLAGLSLTAVNTASDINAGGPFTLLSVAAVVMGGCSLLGGLVAPFGVVAGAVTLSLIGALLSTINVSTDYNAAVQGLILLLMLLLGATINRRRKA